MFVVFGQIKAIFVNKNTVNNTDCLLLAFWLLIFLCLGSQNKTLVYYSHVQIFFTTWESGNTDIVILSGVRDTEPFRHIHRQKQMATGTQACLGQLAPFTTYRKHCFLYQDKL